MALNLYLIVLLSSLTFSKMASPFGTLSNISPSTCSIPVRAKNK